MISFGIAPINSGLVQSATTAENIDKIKEKEESISILEKQILELQDQINKKQGESKTLQNELDKLNAQVKRVQLEIQKLQHSIDLVNGNISTINSEIDNALVLMEKHKNALSSVIRVVNKNDQENLTEIMLKNNSLSDFFSSLHDIETTHSKIQLTIDQIKELKVQLDDNKDELENRKGELEQLRSVQEIEKSSLSSVKARKNYLLTETKGEESKYQTLVQESKRNIEKLRGEISSLQGRGVTAEDAVTFGEMVANRFGIRPAFLLGILEIESRMGKNVGSGNWRDDMYLCYLRLADIYPTRKSYYTKRAEDEKNAFLHITSQMGIDPDSVKVSAEPAYGCGGAMGPAQFIPTTWLGYEDRVRESTGHTPNPWSIEDAFTASAIKLARGGASEKTREGETRAAKAYISGDAYCTKAICNSYANAVLQKAEQIEQNL